MIEAKGEARERAGSVAAVALLHAALGYALLVGLGVAPLPVNSEAAIEVVDVAPVPPPPPVQDERPVEVKVEAAEGRAAPAGLKARAAPVVAPPPVIPQPSPVRAAEVAGTGSETKTGNSDVPGPGPGAGGVGNGTGSGGEGNGAGSGGGRGSPARLLRGGIARGDYPRSAWRGGVGGSVTSRLTIGANGRVTACRVVRGSGNADIDATTCRLIQRRFRYAPARNRAGEAVASDMEWTQRWWLEPGRDDPVPAED